MLPKESALALYHRIADNDKTGNYEQKVLGLRRIFDSVLLEMFRNISERDNYRACIDQIFEVKKKHGEFTPYDKNKQREYHRLRLYFNNLMHSKIEADEAGYLFATRLLSSLINYCSQLEVPADVSAIYAGANSNTLKTKTISHRDNPPIITTCLKEETPLEVLTPPTLCLIIDRRCDLSHSQLLEIENGITKITQYAANSNFNFIVFTIKLNLSILTFPITQKKKQFSFNGSYDGEQIKPLRDYLVNLKPEVQYHFFLTRATVENRFRIPVSLNDSSFLMTIGIIEKDANKNISYSRNSSSFDKLILDSNLPSFFDWIVKFLNNE